MTIRCARLIVIVVVLTGLTAACGADSNPVADASSATVDANPAAATESPTSIVTSSTAPAFATVPPAAATTLAPAPAPTTIAFPAAPRVLLIGDSTLQSVGRYDKLGALTGMDPVYEARSCRLLAVPSCGRNPAPNAIEVIDTAEGAFDMVVIMAGYDQWYDTFADSFDQVVAHSRAKGAKRIIWLTYQENVDYLLPNGTPGNDSLVNINQIMRDLVASGAYPDVVIADWFHYATALPDWFNKDDIHLSPTGATGVADYISRKVAFTASLPCPMPREPDAPAEVPCSDPDVAGPVADVAALYAT